MSFTVVPLHNLELPADTRIEFGAGFVLQALPSWVREEPILKGLSRRDREGVLAAKFALVAEYKAAAIGESDPTWKGEEPRSVQKVKDDAAIMASIAIWLTQPSMVCYTGIFHATSWAVPGSEDALPVIQQIEIQTPVYCHPKDVENQVTVSHLGTAARFHTILVDIPRKNPVWEALRSTWAALTMYSADRRYPFFWMALESLFGADDAAEIGYKLAQRISFFLADTPDDARELFKKVKACYRMRSIIIHGRWKDDPKIDEVMYTSEAIVRTVFRDLISNPDLLRTFISRHRDKFLEDWVFSRKTDRPPYPPAD
jgi:hypothetical protein